MFQDTQPLLRLLLIVDRGAIVVLDGARWAGIHPLRARAGRSDPVVL
jgi:hypothetical protein